MTSPVLRITGGLFEEQPVKLHPTWVEVDISVAPGEWGPLLTTLHAVPFESSFTFTTSLLSITVVDVQLST